MSGEYVSECRRKRKADQVRVMGGKCMICGFDMFVEAQEFHHLDPSQKDFGISSGSTKSLKSQLEEIRKCVQVCANCHRGIHYGHIQPPSGTIFLEDVAENLLKKQEKQFLRTIHRCPICGAEISFKAKMCLPCRTLARRKTERPSRECLKEMIRKTSFSELGRAYGVDGNTIRTWCKEYRLPHTKKLISSITEKEWPDI